MNCKPGDLAVIVKNLDGNTDRFVFVESDSGKRDSGNVWWVCTSASAIYTFNSGRINPGERMFIADSVLRPIRDPGDDATDEMVQLLGKPSEVTA